MDTGPHNELDDMSVYIPRDSEESDWERASDLGEHTWTDDELDTADPSATTVDETEWRMVS